MMMAAWEVAVIERGKCEECQNFAVLKRGTTNEKSVEGSLAYCVHGVSDLIQCPSMREAAKKLR
jgi:hypothetical protein